jgi:hypothetical protein
MRSLELTLPEETARSLEVEAEMLGYDELDGYLAWLVRHRFAIDDESDRASALQEYADRIQDIELEDETALMEAARLAGETAGRPIIDGEAEQVDRIVDESLHDEAQALNEVEGDAIDELARNAVAQTREQLGSGFGSGIDYDPRTDIGSGTRPGEDIADLDDIEVPGWDDSLIAQRREAVGAALAFLKSVEEAKRSDFVSELYENYPAGYDSEGSWWECIKRGLRQVDRVNPAREDSRIWSFRTTPGRVTRISYA